MIVKHFDQVERKEVTVAGAEKTAIRWLIGKESPAPNFYLRLFEIEPHGHSPRHEHAMEHEIYVLQGQGCIQTPAGPVPLKEGSFALVLPHEEHRFENTGRGVFRFLCVIPKEG